jgi:hypothetical protein
MLTVAPKETPGLPLPAMVAAVWGGFLFEGLLATGPNPRRPQDVLEAWKQGCIELVIATSIFLPEVWRQICATWETSDADFPGEFEYEVVSPLGMYLGDYLLAHQGQLPEPETVKAKIQELIQGFFSAGA